MIIIIEIIEGHLNGSSESLSLQELNRQPTEGCEKIHRQQTMSRNDTVDTHFKILCITLSPSIDPIRLDAIM